MRALKQHVLEKTRSNTLSNHHIHSLWRLIFCKVLLSSSTLAIARVVATRSKGEAYGVVGGGETVAALKRTHTLPWVDHVSTGGGAMLEYLGGSSMPGIAALMKNKV